MNSENKALPPVLPLMSSGYSYYAKSGLRYIVVDLNRNLATALWHSGGTVRVSNWLNKTWDATSNPDSANYNPISVYAGLKLITNGTFNGPAGHLVGYKYAAQNFKELKSYVWNPASNPPAPDKRWYFAVTSRGIDGVDPFNIVIDRPPVSVDVSNFQTLIHGGILLLKPGVLDASVMADQTTYKIKFNSIGVNDDQYRLKNGTFDWLGLIK
jgi:hypothetical protein